jgi:hypothetical protein
MLYIIRASNTKEHDMDINFKDVWEAYQSSWNVTSVSEKLAQFEQAMDKNAIYQDPLAKTKNWDELVAYMIDFHQQVPDSKFTTTYFQAHNNQSIATWDMTLADGTVAIQGISHGIYNSVGKLVSMSAFYELPPKK